MRHRGIAAVAAVAACGVLPSGVNAASVDIGKLVSISVEAGTGSAAGGPSTATTALTDRCGPPPNRVWQAFLMFGDPADYWFAPGGDFERGPTGWSLDNAKVVPGNDETGVAGGLRSLAIGGGLVSVRGTAVSPPFCVTAEHPTFRYTLRANGAVGLLATYVRYTAVDGSTQEQEVKSNSATNLLPGTWKPSDLQPLATKLPMQAFGGVARVQLVFRTSLGALGTGYQLDNILVDPYRTR